MSLAKPYRIEIPAPRNDLLVNVRGTKIFTPDGMELPMVLGVRVDMDVDGVLCAHIKVPVRIQEVDR